MRKIFSVGLLVIFLASSGLAQGLNKRQEIFVADRGSNISQTISDVLSGVGTRDITLVFNRGPWSITNALSVSSNIVLSFEPGSPWSVISTVTCTWDNVGIDAGHYEIFTGAGAVTGSFRGTYRVPEWGATGSLRIGDGDLPTAGELTTNDYAENGGSILTTNVFNTNLASSASDITGAWILYSNTTTVIVDTGDGVCKDKYFSVTSRITHTLTSVASAEDLSYVYVDYSATTSTIVTIVDATNDPVYNVDYQGWYNGDDRVLGAVYSSNGVSTIMEFVGEGGSYSLYGGIPIATNMNPDGTWQVPNIAETSTKLPVNATESLFWVSTIDGDSTDAVGATTAEATNQTTDVAVMLFEGGDPGILGFTNTIAVGWIPLGASKNIRITGEDNDDNFMSAYIKGWRLER